MLHLPRGRLITRPTTSMSGACGLSAAFTRSARDARGPRALLDRSDTGTVVGLRDSGAAERAGVTVSRAAERGGGDAASGLLPARAADCSTSSAPSSGGDAASGLLPARAADCSTSSAPSKGAPGTPGNAPRGRRSGASGVTLPLFGVPGVGDFLGETMQSRFRIGLQLPASMTSGGRRAPARQLRRQPDPSRVRCSRDARRRRPRLRP